jgi:acyl-CoA thioesterase-1
VVFGDSVSAAYGIKPSEGWVSLLAERLRKHAPDYRVVNASISGETAAGGRRRIDSVLSEHRPAIIVIELGGNDGLRGAKIEAIRADLDAIIDASLRRKVRVLLVGMRLPPNYGAQYVERFHQNYLKLAKERAVALVPFLFEGFGERQEFFLADGIHPSKAAQPLMLESVWNVLKTMLPRSSPDLRPTSSLSKTAEAKSE